MLYLWVLSRQKNLLPFIIKQLSLLCPVITSDLGSLTEVAGTAAYFVDGYSVASIARGIQKVFYDEKMQKLLTTNGLEQAKKFSWKKTAEETMEIYKTVMI